MSPQNDISLKTIYNFQNDIRNVWTGQVFAVILQHESMTI